MTLYLDTSAVVSLLAVEPASKRLAAWLRNNEAAGLAISLWVDTEVASALSLKVRTGQLSPEQRAEADSEWQRLRAKSLALLPIVDGAFETAAGFAARHALNLRAGDALHLAVAAAHGCTLVTLDRKLAKAASKLGVPVAAI